MKPSEEDRRRASALAALEGLDVFEAATLALASELALPNVRSMVATIPEEQLREVLVFVALNAVWRLPTTADRPRTDREIDRRMAQIRRWVHRSRLEAQWVAS